jgi:hypothetical protein
MNLMHKSEQNNKLAAISGENPVIFTKKISIYKSQITLKTRDC